MSIPITKNNPSEYEMKYLKDINIFLQLQEIKKYKTARYKNYLIRFPNKENNLKGKIMKLDVNALNIRFLPTIESNIKYIIRKDKKYKITFYIMQHLIMENSNISSIENWGYAIVIFKLKGKVIGKCKGWCMIDYLKELKK